MADGMWSRRVGSAGRTACRVVAVLVLAALWAVACSSGSNVWRKAVLRKGAINISEAIEEATGCQVSVTEALFSPDSSRILVNVVPVCTGLPVLWVYGIDDGSLIQNDLRPGWVLSTASFSGDGRHLLLTVERPSPPTCRLYQTKIGSTDWANLTDLVPSAYLKKIQVLQSPDEETYAVVSVGEGHPDLTVSRSGEVLLETQAYPGYVKLIGWGQEGSFLYVESDMPLNLGLTMEQREGNENWDESMLDGIKPAFYAIHVDEKTVRIADPAEIPHPSVSPDGHWKLHIIPITDVVSGLFLTPQ